MESILIEAELKDNNLRVDAFLASKLEGYSRAQVAHLIKDGLVSLGGRSLKASYKINGNEVFHLSFPAPSPSSIEPENIPLDILFSDDHLAVINKPVGLVVHPGAGIKNGTLCHALLYHFPEMVIGNQERPGIVHRLDKDTSGVMVVAKTQSALQALSQDFKDRAVKKIYRAFAYGEILAERFELKTGHARHPQNRLRFFTGLPVPAASSHHVRMAHSAFFVDKRGFGISSLKVTLHTGRTHQIRAHLADINHPLLGDHLYGGCRALTKNVPQALVSSIAFLQGQALHAETIEFPHPKTREMMSFSAPLPKELTLIDDILARIS